MSKYTSFATGGIVSFDRPSTVGETPIETTYFAGQLPGADAHKFVTPSTLAVGKITDLDTTTIQVVSHPQTLKDEIARLRTELDETNRAALAAAADTATARQVLRLAVDQHDREIKALKQMIAGLVSTIAFQERDLERLAAAAIAREYAAHAGNAKAAKPGAPDDDWVMPAGLPCGMR